MKISKFEENSLRNYQEYYTRIQTHRKSWEGWKYDKFIKSVSDDNKISLDRKYDKFNQRQTENNINSLGLYYLYNKNARLMSLNAQEGKDIYQLGVHVDLKV